MKRSVVKDAGRTIEELLRQPISLPGEPESFSLLSAAEAYQSSEGTHSALAKILLAYAMHPEVKEILIREFQLIRQELK